MNYNLFYDTSYLGDAYSYYRLHLNDLNIPYGYN